MRIIALVLCFLSFSASAQVCSPGQLAMGSAALTGSNCVTAVTPVAVATTGNMTAGLLGLAGCQSTTVTISGAAVGTNAAIASPIGMPTSSSVTAGLVNVNAYVSAANTVTVSVCALAALTTAAIPYKVLLY